MCKFLHQYNNALDCNGGMRKPGLVFQAELICRFLLAGLDVQAVELKNERQKTDVDIRVNDINVQAFCSRLYSYNAIGQSERFDQHSRMDKNRLLEKESKLPKGESGVLVYAVNRSETRLGMDHPIKLPIHAHEDVALLQVSKGKLHTVLQGKPEYRHIDDAKLIANALCRKLVDGRGRWVGAKFHEVHLGHAFSQEIIDFLRDDSHNMSNTEKCKRFTELTGLRGMPDGYEFL